MKTQRFYIFNPEEKKITNRFKKNKKACWWIFVGFCIGITPYAFHIADLERGFDATGSEILIPFIPILVWVMIDSIKKLIGAINND